jgi:hypothetical protein
MSPGVRAPHKTQKGGNLAESHERSEPSATVQERSRPSPHTEAVDCPALSFLGPYFGTFCFFIWVPVPDELHERTSQKRASHSAAEK